MDVGARVCEGLEVVWLGHPLDYRRLLRSPPFLGLGLGLPCSLSKYFNEQTASQQPQMTFIEFVIVSITCFAYYDRSNIARQPPVSILIDWLTVGRLSMSFDILELSQSRFCSPRMTVSNQTSIYFSIYHLRQLIVCHPHVCATS